MFCTFGQVKKVARVAVRRDIHQPTKVFEFVRLILRP